MQIRNLVVAGMVLVAVAAQSCKKDEVKNVNDTLLSGNWHIHTATISGDSIPTTNAIGTFIDPCDADDLLNFESNGVLIQSEGPTSCNATDPAVDTTTWSLSADESLLTIDQLPMTVVSHTNNSLVGTVTDLIPNTDLTITLRND